MQVLPSIATLKRVSLGCAAAAALTFLSFHAKVDFASAIPLYLLLVIVHSLAGDFWASSIVAALSVACLDLFFTEPLFSLRISNPLNVVALVTFFVTALIVTRLVARVRKEVAASQRQKSLLDRLYRISRRALTLEPTHMIGQELWDPLHQMFGVTAVSIFDAETSQVETLGNPRTDLEAKTREAFIHGNDDGVAGSPVVVRCVWVRGKVAIAVGFEGLRDAFDTAGPLAALAATIVERKRAFQNASNAAAEMRAEAFRSALLDALAHEFKTPLATILAAAGGMREVGPLSPEQAEMAETVENETARLGSLTSRLLRTARFDNSEIKPQMEDFDVTSLAAQVVVQHAGRSPDRTVVLKAADAPVELCADRELLRLTLNQLVENACKYSHPGSIVWVQVQRRDNLVVISVSNNGSSIPVEERSHIFERFYRGSAARRSTSGSGLGLHVARKIATAHHGTLDLEVGESAPDEITFSLKLPIAKDESPIALATY